MNQSLSVAPHQQKDGTTENPTAIKQQQQIKQLIVPSLEMSLALPLGLALSQFNIGGIAWIFGGIASGVAVLQTSRIFYNYSPKPNRTSRKIGLVLAGLTIGASNDRANLADVAAGVPIFLFLTLFLLLCGGCIGYIYSRLSKTNLLTAMLATTPGGVGIMAAIAADYDKNVTLVALVQALRVTSVVFLIPLVARASSSVRFQPQALSLTDGLFSFNSSHLILLSLALLVTGLAVYLATLLKIPAAPFFAALLVGMAFNRVLDSLTFVGDIKFTPPLAIKLLSQILLGISIGEYWGGKSTIRKQTIGYALMSVAMTLAAGAIAALLAMQLTSWDWLTCLLVTAPGGSAEIILVAMTLNHNVEIVTAGHVVRLIAINISLPIWVFLCRRLDGLDGQLDEAA